MSLISTSDLRIWLSIEEGDKGPNTKLDSVSKAVEDFVDSYCMRPLEARTYFNHFDYSIMDGQGTSWIYLPIFPVSYVSSVYVDNDRDFASSALIASDDIFFYSNGKVVSEGGYFTRGRRNVRIDYTAGYAPVVGGTHNSAISTYPIPLDLKQVLIEMAVDVYKEGATAIHTVESQTGEIKMIQMLSKNSFWRNVLNKYKDFSASLRGREE